MKITSPLDMKPDLSALDLAVSLFEKEWNSQSKGSKNYHLVINGEFNRETCKEIEKLYKNAGWQRVQCSTSSEKGERGGLTGLRLEFNF